MYLLRSAQEHVRAISTVKSAPVSSTATGAPSASCEGSSGRRTPAVAGAVADVPPPLPIQTGLAPAASVPDLVGSAESPLLPPVQAASRETAEKVGATTWASEAFRHSPLTTGQSECMAKLKRRDLSGIAPKIEQFLPLPEGN